ncbi:MAG: Uma2 family endonuclease [Microcoleus sp. PH2017_40_RAT_O_B]|uniref:Uma2 family endonuclease n=1 Tax=unclassified Microcoleus TaxID=2642155 RepID=UPI001E140B17|nr:MULTISPECIES: Uma2 family endonuclease [unclassified Microcoleus]MCC3571834.1 Uma2 family endonuclease [Microcoleus sp. PH2017_34_RAT_O_A]MCC3609461.1 Uma2 family endonuclease [Microcoleus sp. PH2017_40_RAT_O_B]
MTATIPTKTSPQIIYPDSDGKPMSDNTQQFELIVTIQGGIDALYKDNENVFVAGDLLWYPVEGDNKTRQAPDTMVVFGRPKGYRGSYQQWLEDNIAPQVVFEILSPGNRLGEIFKMFKFYEDYGVEECYFYDLKDEKLIGWVRSDGKLNYIELMDGWVSPRLQIRFQTASGDLEIYRPDGQKFLSYVELSRQKELAQQQMEQERQEKELVQQKADRLSDKLREMGINPDEI